jgi:glycosyltransferase involved in cell wall biosynthesis
MGCAVHKRRKVPGESAATARAPVILYTLGSLEIGGTEICALRLLSALKRERPGLAIILYVTSPTTGPLDSAFRALDIRIVQGPGGLVGLLHIWWTCVASRVSVLHANADIAGGFYCLAAAAAGVKRRIAHFATTAPPGTALDQRLILHIGRILLRAFGTRVVGVCEGARALAGVGDERWLTLYTGVGFDNSPVPRTGRLPRNLLVLGRIHPEKGYSRAVDIFDALMTRTGSPTSLHFVGSGAAAQMDRLRRRIEASPFRASISICGASLDPRHHLRRATVLLLPSDREGLPGAILEALSKGVPVVASDLPGCREIERVSKGVRLVAPDAPIREWADRVEEALREGPSDEIKSHFGRGPFLFDDHLRKVKRLWGLAADGRDHEA